MLVFCLAALLDVDRMNPGVWTFEAAVRGTVRRLL